MPERPSMFKHTVFVPATLREKEEGQRGIGATQKGAIYDSMRSSIRMCLSLWGIYVESIPSCRCTKLWQSLGMSTGLRRIGCPGRLRQLICWHQLARCAIITIAGYHHITTTFPLCGGTAASRRRSSTCCLAWLLRPRETWRNRCIWSIVLL